MRLIQFILNGKQQFGAELKDGQRVLNLSHIAESTIDFLRLTDKNESLYQEVNDLVNRVNNGESNPNIITKSSIERLLAPVTNPDKCICMGMNYIDHCEEQNAPIPVEPIIFNKFPSCIVGPYDPLLHPKYDDITQELDWEIELAFVIGKQGKYIPKSEAYKYVAGYTVSMDASARDLQLKRNNGQWLLGKTLDTFCPLGPALVTPDEIPDVNNLQLSLHVNGVCKQNSNTSKMIHKIDTIVSYMSKYFTLFPGDVVVSGTPPGVGVFRKPPEFLKIGDVVECTIESVGTIRNQVVREQ